MRCHLLPIGGATRASGPRRGLHGFEGYVESLKVGVEVCEFPGIREVLSSDRYRRELEISEDEKRRLTLT